MAKFRLKFKKVGTTTGTFKYDLNQIPYDYTVEVRNRFKGLDLIDRMPDGLWMEVHDIVQETGIKNIPKKKKCKKAQKRLSDFTFTFHFHALEKEMATHSSALAWRIPAHPSCYF